MKNFANRATGKGPGTKYIVVEHKSDGSKQVTDHPSKKSAHEHAKELRSKGATAYAHPRDLAQKLGLDPRGGGGGDQPRDSIGRFAEK